MKSVLSVFLQGYLLVGSLLACVLAGSYFAGAFMAAGFSGLLSLPIFGIILAIPLRALFWLPSFVLWVYSGSPGGVFYWAAPGLFTATVG